MYEENGREAAEFSVRSLLSDYYATPGTWAVPHALDCSADQVKRRQYEVQLTPKAHAFNER